MTKSSTWLLDYAHNVYSQNGEDGILGKILEMLPNRDYWCVEFGAWDGVHLTNTRHLILEKGYSALLIEADFNRFLDLQKNYANQTRVITKNAFVGFTASDGLDALGCDTPLPLDFDLLSIDIDGNDYHVWKAIERYTPKVVIVEFNQTIPTPVRFVQPALPTLNQGSSLLSLTDLGREKGYELVCVVEHNAIFVRREYYPLFELTDNSPEGLRVSTEDVTYLFSGYDGTVFLRGACRLPWHALPLTEVRLQQLPRWLRIYTGNYTPLQQWALHKYRTFLHLKDTLRAKLGA